MLSKKTMVKARPRPCLAGALRLSTRRAPSLDTIFEDLDTRSSQPADGDLDLLEATLQHASLSEREVDESVPSAWPSPPLASQKAEDWIWPADYKLSDAEVVSITANPPQSTWQRQARVWGSSLNDCAVMVSPTSLTAASLRRRLQPQPLPPPRTIRQPRGPLTARPSRHHRSPGLDGALAIQDRAIAKGRVVTRRNASFLGTEAQDAALAQQLSASLRLTNWSVSATI